MKLLSLTLLRIYVQRCRKQRENIISHSRIFHNSVLFLIWKNIRTERKWNKLQTPYINCFLRCPIATPLKISWEVFAVEEKNKSFQISLFYKLGKFHRNFFPAVYEIFTFSWIFTLSLLWQRDWFLYDRDLRHEKVKSLLEKVQVKFK